MSVRLSVCPSRCLSVALYLWIYIYIYTSEDLSLYSDRDKRSCRLVFVRDVNWQHALSLCRFCCPMFSNDGRM